MPEAQIIHISYDDAAKDPDNPVRGKLFNEQIGQDVYFDCNIDYTGDDVNFKNFTHVMLRGKKDSLYKKVLETNEKSNVFLYINSLGGEGILSFPNFEYLYAD